MRLTEQERARIRQAVDRHFGPEVRARLFGSRVDAEGRGGDIDLVLDDVDATPADVVERKIAPLLDLRTLLGDQRIDVVELV